MSKKFLRCLAMLNCLLFTCQGMVWADEAAQDSSDVILDEVVVNAVPLEKYLVTTSVITDKEIAAMGAQNLTQVLESVPGLNVHRGKKNAATVDIRGSQYSYTKVYIDGVFVNPFAKVSKSAMIDLNMYPVDNIAKIEIIKGPAPVTYGTDAIGGIILITTKNGKDYPGGKVSLIGGSNNTRNGFVTYGGGDDKFNYFISAGAVHNDGYDDEPNATLKTNFINTKLNWRFKDDSSLTLIGGYSLTDSGASLQMYDPYGKAISSTSGFWPGLKNWQYRDWEKENLSLDYVKKVNSKLDFDIKAYRYHETQELWADGREYDQSLVYNWSGNVATKIGASSAANKIGATNRWDKTRWNFSTWDAFINGVESQIDWKLHPKHTLTFGTMYNKIGWKTNTNVSDDDPSDPDNFNWRQTYSERFDYYLQDNITPNEKTTVTFGIRQNRNEYTDSDNATRTVKSTDPIVNMVYQFDDRNTLRASYGETCSFPILSMLFGANGTADLKPEKSKNYEVGLKHQFDENTTGDIAIFQNNITDKFGSLEGNKQKTINLSWAKIKGVELNLDKKFTPRWSGFVNYTLLDTAAVYQDSSQAQYVADLTYTPRNHINYGVDYKAAKGYTYSLAGHWVPSHRYTNDSLGSDNRTKAELYPELSGYHTIDLRVKRQINEKQDWYVTVYNLFNEQYEEELFYPADGRTVIVGADFRF